MIHHEHYSYIDDVDFPFHIQYGESNEPLPIHNHDFMELALILRGTGSQLVDGYRYEIAAGDVFLIKEENIAHAFINFHNIAMYNILFSKEILQFHDQDISVLEGYQTLFIVPPFSKKDWGFKNRLSLDYEKLQEAKKILDQIYLEYSNKTPGYKTIIKSLFNMFIVHVCREYSRKHNTLNHKAHRISKAIAFMEKNYINRFSLDEIAAKANLSRRQFCRIFKEQMGISPLVHVTSLRIKKSMGLLKNTDLQVAEIAFASGFNSSNYFIRKFAEMNGITPASFREKSRI
jgi:AraC-like DNA-binding protein